MKHDPALIAEAKPWLVKAVRDLQAAELSVRASPALLDDAVFHCQQAAEKAMKGFLAWHDRPFRKTHNLIEIGEQCSAIAPELEQSIRKAAPLTEYAWKYRYPGEADEPPPDEASEALATAGEVVRAIIAALPEPVRP